MKHSPFKITIPEPCNENWDTMLPNEKGKFCLACQETVIDFSQMSDSQLISYFQNYKGSACGRFSKLQLDRPLYQSLKINLQNRWSWLLSIILLPLGLKAQSPHYQPLTQVTQNISTNNLPSKNKKKNTKAKRKKQPNKEKENPKPFILVHGRIEQ